MMNGRRHIQFLWGVLCGVAGAMVPTASLAAPAPCSDSQVAVKAKSRVRKGPGLNYRVAKVLKGRTCVGLEQVSVDGRWALIRLEESFGWVVTSRLGKKGREMAESSRPKEAPLGTGGLGRQFAQTTVNAPMRSAPSVQSGLRRTLPQKALVLPLRLSSSGKWVEVRDSRGGVGWVEQAHLRGEMFDDLPIADVAENGGVEAPAMGEAEVRSVMRRFVRVPSLAATRMAGPSDSVRATFLLGGSTFLPLLRLNSNGDQGIRRYDVSALSGGISAGVHLNGLGPLTARAHVDFAMMSGLAAEAVSASTVGGTSISTSVMLGWALSLGGSVLIPEIGYGFDSTSIDPAFPDSDVGTVFISGTTHAALVGLRYQAPLGSSFLFEADASFLGGFTSSGPETLGQDDGLAIGGRGSFGLQYLLNSGLGIALQYRITGFSSEFVGTGTLDPTIDQAILTEIRQTVVIGVSYAL